MMTQRSSRIILQKHTKKKHKFTNGMFVGYTGRQHSAESRRYMAAVPVVPGATYTVAQTVDDGSNVWLFLQEFPGVRCYADGFVPIPHQAEDHWQLAEAPAYATAEA